MCGDKGDRYRVGKLLLLSNLQLLGAFRCKISSFGHRRLALDWEIIRSGKPYLFIPPSPAISPSPSSSIDSKESWASPQDLLAVVFRRHTGCR